MAPKKKSRISSTTSPAPPPSSKGSGTTVAIEIERRRPAKEETKPARHQEAEETDTEAAQIVTDPWTDEEEIGLFKGLIRWKPTGVHKHFHLLSLHQHLLTNGYIHPRANHTRIPGIWAKLRDLYDLDALDERENAHAAPWSPDPDDDDEETADRPDELGDDIEDLDHHETEFELPDDDFGDLMWRARFPSDTEARLESPSIHLELLSRPESPPIRFVPSFEIAPAEAQTPSSRARGASKTKPGTTTTSKSKTKAAAIRKSNRVADSVDPEDDEQEESGDSDDQSEQASTVGGTPAPRGSKAKTTTAKRLRAPPKGRSKRRR